MAKLTPSQRGKITTAIEHHEKFRNAYSWSPPANAAGRRSYEQKNSFVVSFTHDGNSYCYTSDVSCSCRNVYYRGHFSVNGKVGNVSIFKKLLK